MHIAIEGMDGVGKTTTAKKLAEKINFRIIEKPLHYLFDDEHNFDNYIKFRDYINEQIDNDALRAWFYGLGNIFLYHRFQNENIITDRHFVSNYFWCGSEKTENIFKCMIELVGKPDFTFLLYSSVEEGIIRIKKRDRNDPDLKKANLYPEAKKKMETFLKKYSMEYIAIDTTNLNADEVVDKIIEKLSSSSKYSFLVIKK